MGQPEVRYHDHIAQSDQCQIQRDCHLVPRKDYHLSRCILIMQRYNKYWQCVQNVDRMSDLHWTYNGRVSETTVRNIPQDPNLVR